MRQLADVAPRRGASRLIVALSCAVACAPRGSSFETLGVPPVPELEGRGTIVLGWAKERRDGWSLDRIVIDRRARREWNAETQAPAVIHLTPGTRSLQLFASKKGSAREGARARHRRLKSRPVVVEVERGDIRLCVVRLAGERRLPRIRCTRHLPPTDEGPRREQDATVIAGDRSSRGDHQPDQGCGCLEEVIERIASIERRLDALSGGEDASSTSSTEQRPARATTYGPKSSAQFDPNFESEPSRRRQKSKSWPQYHRFDESFEGEPRPEKTPFKVEY